MERGAFAKLFVGAKVSSFVAFWREERGTVAILSEERGTAAMITDGATKALSGDLSGAAKENALLAEGFPLCSDGGMLTLSITIF